MHPLQLASNVLLSIQSFQNAFYYQYATDKAMYYVDVNHTNKMDFWKWAEALETLEDVYEVTQDAGIKQQIGLLAKGFLDKWGSDWSYNIYNDDICWASMAFTRASQITGDNSFFTQGKYGFDLVYARGWSLDFGGGIWWNTNNQSKNACVNGPAAIAAMLIYNITGDNNYLLKAKLIMDWERSKLFNYNTGEIYDNYNKNGVQGGATTYNQGTFIGALNFLNPHFPATNYSVSAAKALNFTKNSLSYQPSGLLVWENFCTDCEGFKQILTRWASRFLATHTEYLADFGPWLLYNAQQAWSVRNPTSGLIWERWNVSTPGGNLNGHECANGPSILGNILRFSNGTGFE